MSSWAIQCRIDVNTAFAWLHYLSIWNANACALMYLLIVLSMRNLAAKVWYHQFIHPLCWAPYASCLHTPSDFVTQILIHEESDQDFELKMKVKSRTTSILKNIALNTWFLFLVSSKFPESKETHYALNVLKAPRRVGFFQQFELIIEDAIFRSTNLWNINFKNASTIGIRPANETDCTGFNFSGTQF